MSNTKWIFTDDKGSFRWDNPAAINELYFPLCNEKGLMSAVTPVLHGDIKKHQDHFLLLPVSVEDLHNSKAARNFWFFKEGYGPVSATGNSAKAHLERFSDNANKRSVEAGLLWHKSYFSDANAQLSTEILSFIPTEHEVELMVVTVTNDGSETAVLTPTSSIPIYGRSAENIRDHRHVTSLVNRPVISPEGITMQPVIEFDETGHRYNHTNFYVFGAEGNGEVPVGTFGAIDNFIGIQGDLEWPEAVVKNLSPSLFETRNLDGKECIGALRFNTVNLEPGQRKTYIIMMGIGNDGQDLKAVYNHYNNQDKIAAALEANKNYWMDQAEKVSFQSGLDGFDNWIKWVEVQPVFRKIFGCSFLPHHDYGKGGRGWRDLWQDLLSLILLRPDEARDLLMNNYGGIRVDGSNATIIGSEPGEFIADRNSISRVWMDHGSWPYLTTKMYIDQSGDLDILLSKAKYFRDKQLRRANFKDENWEASGNYGEDTYEGTVLEHILVQHLASFFNVGEHNKILLEGADWNDTLDMARDRGESVAFTALYGSNLLDIADLLESLKAKGITELELFEELTSLLDGSDPDCNYDSYEYKQALLSQYFDKVQPDFSGKTTTVAIDVLITDLRKKGNWVIDDVKANEFVKVDDETGFFNGYYNNDGQAVDGVFEDATRMNLTGQVFTAMYGLATDDQVKASYNACRTYLKDKNTGGYKLNTPLGPNQLNFGRGFSFAYGDKENGAVFSHMVVMYMNALYQRDFKDEAYEVFKSMFDLCMDTDNSKIYPGIPEYFNLEGKGLYHYLTGSASWLFLTVLTEMYGVKGNMGDLQIKPRLVEEQFMDGLTSVSTMFADRSLKITYKINDMVNIQAPTVSSVAVNGEVIADAVKDNAVLLKRDFIQSLPGDKVSDITILMTP